ncbi:MAG: hypothetical protein PVH73_10425 [Candidatus Bathyarchaeota archaeon]|jgi:hypothetical protein
MRKTEVRYDLSVLEQVHRHRIDMLRALYKLVSMNVSRPVQQVLTNEILLSIGRENLALEDILAQKREGGEVEKEDLPGEAL